MGNLGACETILTGDIGAGDNGYLSDISLHQSSRSRDRHKRKRGTAAPELVSACSPQDAPPRTADSAQFPNVLEFKDFLQEGFESLSFMTRDFCGELNEALCALGREKEEAQHQLRTAKSKAATLEAERSGLAEDLRAAQWRVYTLMFREFFAEKKRRILAAELETMRVAHTKLLAEKEVRLASLVKDLGAERSKVKRLKEKISEQAVQLCRAPEDARVSAPVIPAAPLTEATLPWDFIKAADAYKISTIEHHEAGFLMALKAVKNKKCYTDEAVDRLDFVDCAIAELDRQDAI